MSKIKINDSQKEVLLQAMQRLDELQSQLGKTTTPKQKVKAKDSVKKVVAKDDGGLPSENEEWKGLSYIEALYRAREMENEAIEINLLLLELAPEKDAKKFIEIANDENDHDKIYAKIIERIEREKENE